MNTIKLYIYHLIKMFLPETKAFGLKRTLLRWAGAKVGKNVRICSSATFIGCGNLEIGDNTWIGHESMIVCSNNVRIGANCDFAPRVYVGDGSHRIDINSSHIAGSGTSTPVIIGDGCWICANCTILPGVTIAAKCVIAAGSVVTHNFNQQMMLLAGVPCVAKKNLQTINDFEHE